MGEQNFHVDLTSIIDRYQVVDQRKYQIDCIEEIVGNLNNGNDVLIDLPTGTGKTLIYSPIVADVAEKGGSVIVLTATKQAQRRVGGEIKRFERDGKHVLIYGIGEYNCPLSGEKAQHWDCHELKEEFCKLQNIDCDVINSENNFLSNNLVITNFSKFLSSPTNRDYDIIVLDDSHGFENTQDQIHQLTVIYGEARILYERRILSEPLQKMLENFLNLFSEIFERCVNPMDNEGVITPEYLLQLAGILEDDAEQQIKDEIKELPPYSDTQSLCRKIYYFIRTCKASSKHQFYIRKDYYNREDWDSSELISRREGIIDFVIRNCFRKSRVIFVTATPGNAKLHAKSCTLRNYNESGLGEVPSEKINSPVIDDWFKRLKIIVTKDIGDTRQRNPFEKAIKLTTDILEARKERALVLFKNYRDQRSAYDVLSKIFTPEKLFFIDSTSKEPDIVEELADKSQISLASASSTLWEGINIKNLRLSIIITAPFIRPNVGKKDYLLAERRMLVRLQQGIGRIIRRQKDFGVAVLTDSRFVKYVNRKAFSQHLRDQVDLLEFSNILPTISELFESWS